MKARPHFRPYARPRQGLLQQAKDFGGAYRSSFRREPGKTLGITLLVLAIAFGITEAVVGDTNAQPGEVLARIYVPPYTSTERECSGTGESRRCWTETEYHPAKYKLGVDCDGATHVFETTMGTWMRVREGQVVQVAHRDGRWTRIHYLHWVSSARPEAGSW